jgi:hypothetical protein
MDFELTGIAWSGSLQFGLTEMVWNGRSQFWLTGMAQNGRIRFCPDWNGWKWSKSLFILTGMVWTRGSLFWPDLNRETCSLLAGLYCLLGLPYY